LLKFDVGKEQNKLLVKPYRLPNLLIVGVQKCGTSHAHKVLSQSPDVQGSEIKELNFFNKKNCANRVAQDEYRQNFKTGPQKYYLESTPHYFRLPLCSRPISDEIADDVAENIRRILPPQDRKLLVILRNPIERAISATIHHMMAGRIPKSGKIDAVVDRFGIINRGYYARILQHWRTVFDEDIGVFFYDNLHSDPTAFYQNICEYIKIDASFLDVCNLTDRENSKEKRAKSNDYNNIPTVTRGVAEQLRDIYHEDIGRLFRDEGVNFPGWLSLDKIHSVG